MKTWFLVLPLATLALPALAQAPSPPPAPAAAGAPDAAKAPPDAIKAMLDQETQIPPGGYSYNPSNRRDPFVSLQRPVAADQSARPRPKGIGGFLIQEVALKGIVKAQAGYTAMLLGPDGQSYFVTVGKRLFDVVITGIDATSISFRQEVTDPLSPVKTRDVKKSLYSSEEARQ